MNRKISISFLGDIRAIEKALEQVGFSRSSGRHFIHPETEYFVEFPVPPLAVGNMPVKEWTIQNNKAGRLQLLTATHSVMDRLAGYFHWNDKRNLDQALMVARNRPIKLNQIAAWAKGEGESEKFEVFREKLSRGKK